MSGRLQAGPDAPLVPMSGPLRRVGAMASIIEAEGLTKRFGETQALAGLDLVAESGRVTALLGVAAPGAVLRNEVRAVYGGFGIAMAVVLLGSDAAGELVRGEKFVEDVHGGVLFRP